MTQEVQQRRVFVGIKVSADLAEYSVAIQSRFALPDVRLIPPEDMHVTLLPPWDTTDEKSVIQKLEHALRTVSPFTLKLDHLVCAPSVAAPTQLRITCDASPEIVAQRDKLSNYFDMHEVRPFLPHVTIARFKKEFQVGSTSLDLTQRVEFGMNVSSVALFESPIQGGVGYKILASVPLV